MATAAQRNATTVIEETPREWSVPAPSGVGRIEGYHAVVTVRMGGLSAISTETNASVPIPSLRVLDLISPRPTFRGRPVLTIEELSSSNFPYPPESDDEDE